MVLEPLLSALNASTRASLAPDSPQPRHRNRHVVGRPKDQSTKAYQNDVHEKINLELSVDWPASGVLRLNSTGMCLLQVRDSVRHICEFSIWQRRGKGKGKGTGAGAGKGKGKGKGKERKRKVRKGKAKGREGKGKERKGEQKERKERG